MRFMVMVKATKDSEAGKMPSEELLSAMAKFNEEMIKAGVMLDGNGLQASSKGARVYFEQYKAPENGMEVYVVGKQWMWKLQHATGQREINELHVPVKGARVRFSGDKRTVIDGPFAETKELVAGYWIIQVKSKAEAIEWIKRCPNPMNEDSEIEIRQIFELEDFGASDAVEHHRQLGEQIAKK